MLMAIERIAQLAVPMAFRLDPEKRRHARQFRDAGSVIVAFMLLVATAFMALVFFGAATTLAEFLFLGAIVAGAATLAAMRRFATLSAPLAIGGTLTAALWGLAVMVSGGAASPFLPATVVLPALFLAHPERAPFFATLLACVVALGATALAPLPPELVQFGRQSHQIIAVFSAFLMGLAGLAALGAAQRAREHTNETQRALDDKTASYEALSSRMAKYLAPQAFAAAFEGTQGTQPNATRKKLTVYFADIVDFTEATEALEPEDLAQLMNEYFSHMAEIVVKHGGTIDKYIGDAILVFFGDPDSKGAAEDAVCCVEMALEIDARINLLRDKWLAMGVTQPLQMRAGINTGYCTVGNFGSENRMDYTIIGGQVNIAARLEQAAKPGTILISHQTQALVRDQFDCAEIGSLQVKGIGEPVKTYQIGKSTTQGTKEALIHEKLDGMSLVIDPNALSAKDRNTARRYLERALARLKD